MTGRHEVFTHELETPADPARAVVLGGRGFIGRALVAALEAAGIATEAPARAELDLAADGAAERLASMLRPTDSVVVLAALTPDRGQGREPFMRNLAIGANVCAALERVPPTHVVYVSSDAVYPLDDGLVSEASGPHPTSLYGMMHLSRELMLRTSTQAPVAVLRPTLVYGAADPHNSYGPNRFRRAAEREGRIVLFGEGEEHRDHVLVDDLVTVARLTLCHRSRGTLNVATGHSITYADLARKVAALHPAPVEIVRTPRQSPITHRHFDVSELRRAFPRCRFTPLETGLARAHRELHGLG